MPHSVDRRLKCPALLAGIRRDSDLERRLMTVFQLGLSIGFHTSLSAGNLRATLLDFRQRVPSIELGLIEMSRTRLLMTAVRTGTIDVRHWRGHPKRRRNPAAVE